MAQKWGCKPTSCCAISKIMNEGVSLCDFVGAIFGSGDEFLVGCSRRRRKV